MTLVAPRPSSIQSELWQSHIARRRRIYDNRIELKPRKPDRFRIIDLRPVKRTWRADVKCQCCRPQPVRWPRAIGISDIARIVAFEFCVDVDEMCSRRRDWAVLRPRQATMYLARMIPILSGRQRSLPEIAGKFGLDHTTVLNGIRVVAERISRDPESEFSTRVERSRRKVIEWANLPPTYGLGYGQGV